MASPNEKIKACEEKINNLNQRFDNISSLVYKRFDDISSLVHQIRDNKERKEIYNSSTTPPSEEVLKSLNDDENGTYMMFEWLFKSENWLFSSVHNRKIIEFTHCTLNQPLVSKSGKRFEKNKVFSRIEVDLTLGKMKMCSDEDRAIYEYSLHWSITE
jgi:hypothetical protein